MGLISSTSAIAKKHNYFQAPSVEITVGGKKLVSSKKMKIADVEVELTCDFEASGASFTIVSIYEAEKTDFDSDISCLAIGEKVSIELGYMKRAEVFQGYVNGITYSIEGADVSITVECMDAKGLLMKNRRMEFFTEKSADAVVSKLLGESPVSTFLAGKSVDSCSEEEVPLRAHQKTDYEIICEQAAKFGYEFFILNGKAYFQASKKNSSELMTLTPGDGIISARSSLSGNGLAKTFEVRGIDQEKGEQIQGTANISGSFGKGGSKLLGSSKQVFYEAGIKDAAEAKARAKARAEAAADNFGELELEVCGIQELVPARFIKVDKMADAINGKYYIHNVKHVMSGSGYQTIVKARRDSL